MKPRRHFAPGYTATPERLALEERRIREAWAPPSTTPELDVHGMDRERAVQELDLWLTRRDGAAFVVDLAPPDAREIPG